MSRKRRLTETTKPDPRQIKEQSDTDMPLAPEAKDDYSFRPLTEAEKKDFMNSLTPEGRRTLEELGDKEAYNINSKA